MTKQHPDCCFDSLTDHGFGRGADEPSHFCTHCSTEWFWRSHTHWWVTVSDRKTLYYRPAAPPVMKVSATADDQEK